MSRDEEGLLSALVQDGRPLLTWSGLALVLSGLFALFLSAAGHFLPHDVAYLGESAERLKAIADGRVASFMFHDRVAFGGALIAIGLLYLWLVEFPLRAGEGWAWWTLLVSGVLGFGSFLAYLGYGYLDTWHGVATLGLLPLFAAGLARTRGLPTSFRRGFDAPWRSAHGIGRALLVATGAGMLLAGGTILVVGMTSVFVPQDLHYMRLSADDLRAMNTRLVPLIAHDRAGFGGGIASCGTVVLAAAWCARSSRSFRQVFALAGLSGFGAAIGVHFAIGYLDLGHLAPAYAGLLIFLAGIALTSAPERTGSRSA